MGAFETAGEHSCFRLIAPLDQLVEAGFGDCHKRATGEHTYIRSADVAFLVVRQPLIGVAGVVEAKDGHRVRADEPRLPVDHRRAEFEALESEQVAGRAPWVFHQSVVRPNWSSHKAASGVRTEPFSVPGRVTCQVDLLALCGL